MSADVRGISVSVAALLLASNFAPLRAIAEVAEPTYERQGQDDNYEASELAREELLNVLREGHSESLDRKPAVLGPAVIAPGSQHEVSFASEASDAIPVTEYDPGQN